MGSAVNEAEKFALAGKSWSEGKGSVSREPVGAASACHSFWEVGGGTTGAKGACSPARLTQHAGVGHFPCFVPQQWHTKGAAELEATTGPVKPCQEEARIAKMARRVVTVLERRADIRFV
jgi:hypothetical protein